MGRPASFACPRGALAPSAARALRAAGLIAGFAIGLCIGAAVPAWAADDAHRVQETIDAIRAGDARTAVVKLGTQTEIDALAAHTDLVHVLCDRAYRYDRATADVGPRQELAAKLVGLAEAAASAAKPEDDRARWALADALVLRERVGPRAGPASWTRAADLLQQVHVRKPADSLPLVYAASFLLEGACIETDAAVALTDRAGALAKSAVDRQKDSPTIAVHMGSAQFWAARTLLPTNKKLAREQLKASLESLRRSASKDAPVLEVATLWNEAVSWSRRKGFVLPERFVTTKKKTLDGVLQLEIPVSSAWSFSTVTATDAAPGYDYVTQMSSDGRRVRQVLFRKYFWNQKYTFEGPNPVGGDNVRSLAQGLAAMTAARVFTAGAKVVAPERKPFNRDLDGYVFDVRGRTIAESGFPAEPLRVTGYVMRGHDQVCFAVLVYTYGVDDEPSPEIENLTASLKEIED